VIDRLDKEVRIAVAVTQAIMSSLQNLIAVRIQFAAKKLNHGTFKT
jgi:hypothetical protein